MAKKSQPVGEPFDGIDFPLVATDETPEDFQTLSLIMAGQRGYGDICAALEATLKSERKFLLSLLRRDWQRRFESLLAEGYVFLSQISGVDEDKLDVILGQPSEEGAKQIASSVNGSKPPQLLELLAQLAEKAFVCQRLLPWKSENNAVFDYFSRCVEAEIQHQDLLGQIRELVE